MIKRLQFTDNAERDQIKANNPTFRVIGIERVGSGNWVTLTDDPVPENHKKQYQKLSLSTLDPTQVDAYIDNNVTNIASAKTVLKLLAKGLIRVAKNQGM